MTPEPEPGEPSWTVVLRPDGIVDEVQGGAPVGWIGHSLSTHPEAPDALREAAERLTLADDGHWVRLRRLSTLVAHREVPVDLVVCHAVPLRRSNVVVRDMVLRVLDLFRLQAPHSGVEVQLEYSESVPVSFPADGEKITWAISTLVGNALRHFQQSSGSGKTARINILVDYDFDDCELVIRVMDNGPGIPVDRRRWLFDKNPQTGRASGLALVMVKDVVLAHRGRLDVECPPGGGTDITLRLPRTGN